MYKHKRPGLLITFCGLDGCGKSTQLDMLKTWLQSKGFAVRVTKQPTAAVRQSDMFRTYMDHEDHTAYNYRALSLLCASDRVQHCGHVILPVLETGGIILSDRYYYSCLANLRARGYTKDKWIYDAARAVPKPDLAIFLDVPVELAVERVRTRAAERNRYIDMELQYRLRKEYIRIAKGITRHSLWKRGALLLDSSKPPEETFAGIAAAVNRLIERRRLSGADAPAKDEHEASPETEETVYV